MKVLAIPDTHCPASSRQLFEKAARVRDKLKPDRIIQLGDLIDAKAWSRFPKSSTDDSAALEWEKTEAQLEIFHQYFPEMTILQGNHTARIMKKAVQDAGLPPKMVKSLDELLGYEDWQFHNKNTPLIIDGVAYIHGDETGGVTPLPQLAVRMGRSVVRGHSHQGGLIFSQFFDRQVFAVEAGALINEDHNAFDYAAKNPRRSFIGLCYVIDGEFPQLIPLK